jgi:hypothetical protein
MTEQSDPILGTLTVHSETGEFTAKQGGIHYHLENKDALPHAHRIVSSLEAIMDAARTHAATKMLELKNTVWPDEDDDENEVVIDATEFQKRMTLESVWVNSNQSMTLWFDDGNLFDGHSIAVEFDGQTWTGSSIQG